MHRIFRVLTATVAYGTAAAHCPAQAGTTAVTFQSSSFSDFRQLLAREAAAGTVTVRAHLRFPEQTKDRYPTVVRAGSRSHA